MLAWWRTFRSALELAARVDRCEKAVAQLQWEWGETLDKMLAREERFRKRYRAAVNASLTEDEEEPKGKSAPPSEVAPVDRRAAVRQQWAAQQRASQGGI